MSQAEEQSLETHHGKAGADQDGSKAKRAATHFFMANAPPARLREVMENCELLVDPSAVSDRFMEDTLEHAAEDQHQVVTFVVPGQPPYQDLSVSASTAPPEAFPRKMEPYREAFATQLTKYVKDRYACNTLRTGLRVPVDLNQAVSVFSHYRNDVTPSPDLTAVMSTVAENKASYWACSWTSEWRVFFSPDDPSSEARIEGDVRVRSYLYEDSSVQANFSRHFGLRHESAGSDDDPKKADPTQKGLGDVCLLPGNCIGTPEKLALELVKAIRTNEEVVIQEIDEFFTNRALRLTKGLRRVLPVYGKAFDWKQQSIRLQPQKLSMDRE